jgi:host factor-I protein
MDKDTQGTGIQDQFLARVRKDRSWLTLILNTGKKIGGRVVSFDRYTLVLEDHGREQLVFKHAVATITATRAFTNAIDFEAKPRSGERDERASKREPGEEPPAGKPPND